MNTEPVNEIGLEIAETVVVEKKKRGRKKLLPIQVETNIQPQDNTDEPIKPPPKKRGRKPKGGKIVQENNICDTLPINEPNIILHLRCSLDDIDENDNNIMKYNPNIESIQSFNFDNSKIDNLIHEQLCDFQTKEVELTTNIITMNNTTNDIVIDNNHTMCDNNSNCNTVTNKKNEDSEAIWDKLTALKTNLHRNTISDKRSACFWCTHDFDNPPIFIPKHEFKNSYQVYGCFCSPECSVAHLMNEKIDSSVKFERYQLLNHVYGKIYNYEKNIKPAPDPHYLLDKFYGTLSIKEYRDLFKTDQLLIVVEKPLTHVFPELYEDNTDFILNQRTIPNNSTFKLKRKSNSKQSSVLETLNSKNK
jgi:hypothetical protein|tara:strand:+ start:5218 stop:6303 length:1086 start_codon:yes stop_codon:yes gene_type:complete